jgi:hypothetical protein
MGTKRRYDITKDKRRFNDDFFLNFKGNEYVVFDTPFSSINSANNWTMSFGLLKKQKGATSVLFDSRSNDVGGQGGISLALLEQPSTYTIRFRNGFNSPTSTQIDFNYNFNYDGLYVVALIYETSTNRISLWVDGFVRDSVSIGSAIINTVDTNYSLLGGLKIPGGTSVLAHLGFILDFNVFDEVLPDIELQNFYETLFLDINSINKNQLNVTLNNVAYNSKNSNFRSVITNMGTSKMLFNYSVVNTDEISSEVVVFTGNGGSVGFKDKNTPAFDNDYYIIGISNGVYFFEKNGVPNPTLLVPVLGDVMSVVISGGNIEYRVNNVFIGASTLTTSLGVLKPFANSRSRGQLEIKNIKYNGVLCNDSDVLSNFNCSIDDKIQLDVVKNNNISATVSHGACLGWSFDELGLNTGTSNFEAYADFYTGNAGENFTGGGDSIIYKNEEIRKFGVKLTAANQQYIELENFNVPNGYFTLLIGYSATTDNNWVSEQPFFSKTQGDNLRGFNVFGESGTKNVGFRYKDPSQAGTNVSYREVKTSLLSSDNSSVQMLVVQVSPFSPAPVVLNTDINELIKSDGLASATLSYNSYRENGTQRENTDGSQWGEAFADIVASTYLGRNDSSYYDHNLLYTVAFASAVVDADISALWNNGLFRNPTAEMLDKYDALFNIDYNNPVDDSGILRYNDLLGNYSTNVQGFANLVSLESAKFEINSLRL